MGARETMITNATDLDMLFPPERPMPKVWAELHGHLTKIADELRKYSESDSKKHGMTFEVILQAPEQNDRREWRAPLLTAMVGERQMYFNIDYDAETSCASRWSMGRPTGRMRLCVGDCGARTSYPSRKDGTFSYDKIAMKLRAVMIHRAGEVVVERAKAANSGIVGALRDKHGLDYYDTRVSTSVYMNNGTNAKREVAAPEGCVYLDLGKLFLTHEQADRVLTLLHEMGK